MKAEDTAISHDPRIQAKISFNAGKQAGIKEVVDYVNDYIPMTYRRDKYWQAKIKEWGIK
jgi:hypothetical protein